MIFFCIIFCWFLQGRIRASKMKRLQMDPDPQHCLLAYKISIFSAPRVNLGYLKLMDNPLKMQTHILVTISDKYLKYLI